LISENLIRPLFKGKLTDSHLRWILSGNMVLVAMVSIYMATQYLNIYELVASASILLLVSLFAPLTAGLYWKKASTSGAVSAMVIGISVYLIAATPKLQISVRIFGLLASIFAMITGSLAFPRKNLSYELF
jgi:Na+/proline symporter